jgi:hypothetical protein
MAVTSNTGSRVILAITASEPCLVAVCAIASRDTIVVIGGETLK